MESQQKHQSGANIEHLEQLFVSTILRNQLKLLKEFSWSYFDLIHDEGLYTRPCQMSLKYLKMYHALHNLYLNLEKYYGILTKAGW